MNGSINIFYRVRAVGALILVAGVLTFLVVALTACEPQQQTAEQQDQAAVNRQQAHYQASQPIPWMEHSSERDLAIQLYQARNKNLRTWTVWRSQSGKVLGWCASVGYPLPYDTSLTNPRQPVATRIYNAHYEVVDVDQAEPNGLFASRNSIATWVTCLHDGKKVPVYVEAFVNAYAWPITVEGDTVRRVEGKAATITVR